MFDFEKPYVQSTLNITCKLSLRFSQFCPVDLIEECFKKWKLHFYFKDLLNTQLFVKTTN